MICPRCGEEFSVSEVRDELFYKFNIDFDDLPEPMCLDCAAADIQENSVTLFEGSEYDPDDPD